MDFALQLAAEKSSSANYLPLLLIAGLFLLTYFMIIRPQSKRRKNMVEMQSSLGPGAEIVTIGGLHATVVETGDDTVDVQIAPGVVATFARGAIARVVPTETDAAEHEVIDEAGSEANEAAESIDEADDKPEAKKAK